LSYVFRIFFGVSRKFCGIGVEALIKDSVLLFSCYSSIFFLWGRGIMEIPVSAISTTDISIKIKGKIIYNDHKRHITLQRPIREMIDAASASYRMEFFLTEDRTVDRVRELSSKKIIPVLLYFTVES
jgi:hypothetical protein